MARADLHDDTRALGAHRWRTRALIGAVAFAAAAAGFLVVGRDELVLSARIEPARSPSIVEPAAVVATTPAPTQAPAPAPPRQPEIVVDEPMPVPAPPKLDRARQVFGATTNAQQQPIERDLLVEETPIAAFRAGWEALRAERYADAIAAFDRATDPAVVEDAMFWAAIAAQRAGHRTDARKRFDEFLARFPGSPRAESARNAREVLR